MLEKRVAQEARELDFVARLLLLEGPDDDFGCEA